MCAAEGGSSDPHTVAALCLIDSAAEALIQGAFSFSNASCGGRQTCKHTNAVKALYCATEGDDQVAGFLQKAKQNVDISRDRVQDVKEEFTRLEHMHGLVSKHNHGGPRSFLYP